MENFDYEKYKEAILRDLSDFEIISAVLHSFFDSDLLRKSSNTQEISILVVIHNSLVANLHITLRRLLSADTRDYSLIHLHQKIMDAKKHDTWLSSHKKLSEPIYKYSTKTFAHNDIKQMRSDTPPWESIESLFKSLKETFMEIAVKQEKASYSSAAKDYGNMADKVFKKWTNNSVKHP